MTLQKQGKEKRLSFLREKRVIQAPLSFSLFFLSSSLLFAFYQVKILYYFFKLTEDAADIYKNYILQSIK